MNNTFPLISRRTLLRGIGATLALPWMESLMWSMARAAGVSTAAANAKAPVRYGVMMFANGVNPHQWSAKGAGEAMELSSTLQPLAAFKKHITVLNELQVYNNTSGPHWPLFSNYLSGAKFKETLIPEGGESIDQLIERHTGKETTVPSLVPAVEPAESGLRSGVPAVYYSTVSWSSKNTPIAPEVFPRSVFDRIFDTSSLLRDKSVLDAVLAQSKDVRRNLGANDQRKLDEFMTSVRDLEQRIERATKEERLEGWHPSLAKPNLARPAAELPQDVREHKRMMCDLMLLAWQMDKTPVATLIFNRDVSHMRFSFLDGVLNDELHGISHHKEAVAKHQQRASAICGRPIGIALHGSSGLPESALREGVAAGVAKVNWSSESLLIRRRAAQDFYATHTAELEKSHNDWKATAMDNGVQSFVSTRYVPKLVERIRVLIWSGMTHLVRPYLS